MTTEEQLRLFEKWSYDNDKIDSFYDWAADRFPKGDKLSFITFRLDREFRPYYQAFVDHMAGLILLGEHKP